MTDLTAKQQRFVEEYLVDLNATQAAIRAGYSAHTAEQQGPRLLGNVGVAAAIAERQEVRAEETGITAARVLQELWEIATADPNDLVQYRKGPCPECYGGQPESLSVAPDGECPACIGEGAGRVFVPDTRDLTGSARKLYAGVKVTKEGLEIKMRSQDAALGRVFDHLGMGVKRHEHSGPNGGPIALTGEDLAARLAKLSPEERADLRALSLKLAGQA